MVLPQNEQPVNVTKIHDIENWLIFAVHLKFACVLLDNTFMLHAPAVCPCTLKCSLGICISREDHRDLCVYVIGMKADYLMKTQHASEQ